MLRGHPTDDSVVFVEPMSRFGLSLVSLGLCLLWPLRGQGKSGLPLFLKFFPNCKQTTIANMTKKVIKVVIYLTCSLYPFWWVNAFYHTHNDTNVTTAKVQIFGKNVKV